MRVFQARRATARVGGESRYKVVVGKRLIGQITLIKGNNVSRFHGRITMPQASQVHLNISLMPTVWWAGGTDMRALFRTHQCP